MLKRLAQSYREMKTLGRGQPRFKKCKHHKGMTFDGTHCPIEQIARKQKGVRNHPTYKICLNGRWYRFALHREIQGEITDDVSEFFLFKEEVIDFMAIGDR